MILRIATSHGIDTEGLLIDQETIDAQNQAEMQNQMAQQVTQGATPAVAQGVVQGIQDGTVDPQPVAQGMQGMMGDQ